MVKTVKLMDVAHQLAAFRVSAKGALTSLALDVDASRVDVLKTCPGRRHLTS